MKIELIDDVVYADGSTIPVTVTVTAGLCTVTYLEITTEIQWSNIRDVEYLATLFEDLSLRVFKVIVLLLTKAIDLKETL